MMSSVYKVLTPAGQFDAIFAEDEDIPIEYSGDELAIGFFKDWLFINQISGEHGHLLDSLKLTPNDLYGFCQPLNSAIEVIPPFDDLMSYTQEEIASKNEDINNQSQEGSAMPMDEFDSAIIKEVRNIADMLLDGISGVDKIKLIKEAGNIRANLQTVQSGMEKLKMVKRIKEIRDALGVKAEANADQQENTAVEAATMADVNNVMPLLKKFIGAAQLSSVGSLIRGEEGQFFKDKMVEIANVIKTMPKTYDQDGMGDKAIAYLHYFKGSGDWYITEKDMEDDQIQAFGLADIFGDGGELGYINIEEIIQHGVELDFHWTPKTIGKIKGADDSGDEKSSEVDLSEFTAQGYESGRNGLGKQNVPQELTDKQKEAWKDGVVNYYKAEKNAISFVQQEEDKKNPDFEAIEQIKKDFSGAYANDLFKIIDRILARKPPAAVAPGDAKPGFISELELLKAETDINRFNERLDEIAARVEQAGLMEALDKELNDTADVLTALLSAAERGGK